MGNKAYGLVIECNSCDMSFCVDHDGSLRAVGCPFCSAILDKAKIKQKTDLYFQKKDIIEKREKYRNRGHNRVLFIGIASMVMILVYLLASLKFPSIQISPEYILPFWLFLYFVIFVFLFIGTFVVSSRTEKKFPLPK